MQTQTVQISKTAVQGPFMATMAVQNDAFRKALGSVVVDNVLIEGQVFITDGVRALPRLVLAQLFSAVREFEAFTPDNDPYGEHDLTIIVLKVMGEERSFYFKIDYYADSSKTFGSDDPVDPAVTYRVGTLLLASEY